MAPPPCTQPRRPTGFGGRGILKHLRKTSFTATSSYIHTCPSCFAAAAPACVPYSRAERWRALVRKCCAAGRHPPPPAHPPRHPPPATRHPPPPDQSCTAAWWIRCAAWHSTPWLRPSGTVRIDCCSAGERAKGVHASEGHNVCTQNSYPTAGYMYIYICLINVERGSLPTGIRRHHPPTTMPPPLPTTTAARRAQHRRASPTEKTSSSPTATTEQGHRTAPGSKRVS